MKFSRVFLTLSGLVLLAIPAQADSVEGDPGVLVSSSLTFVDSSWSSPLNISFSYLFDLTTDTASDVTFSNSGAGLGSFTLSLNQGSDLAWSDNPQGVYDEGILFYTSLSNSTAEDPTGFLDETLYLPGPDGTPFGQGSSMLLAQSLTQSFTASIIAPEPASLSLLTLGLLGLASLKRKVA